jgi:YD repeat-containing protein
MYATNGAGGYVSQPGIYNVLTTSGGNVHPDHQRTAEIQFSIPGPTHFHRGQKQQHRFAGLHWNNLTTITNTVGRVISFAYNANNCLTNITDPLGRTVRFAYDANTNLISVTDTRGGLTQFGLRPVSPNHQRH